MLTYQHFAESEEPYNGFCKGDRLLDTTTRRVWCILDDRVTRLRYHGRNGENSIEISTSPNQMLQTLRDNPQRWVILRPNPRPDRPKLPGPINDELVTADELVNIPVGVPVEFPF